MNNNPTKSAGEPKLSSNAEEPTSEPSRELATLQKKIPEGWFQKIFTVLFWAAIILAIAWFAGAKQFLLNHKTAVIISVIAAVLLASASSTQRWYRRISAQKKIGLVIMLLIVVIGSFFIAVFLLEPKYQAALLRTIFLTIVCSLPALMYYLFITTKKTSLLNEFTLNLTRLGLVDPTRVSNELVCANLRTETAHERKDRVATYFKKFEAVYGAISDNQAGTSNPALPESTQKYGTDSKTLSTIFTVDTTIPVVVATILIALGWLITLPPWEGRLLLGGQNIRTATEVLGDRKAGTDVSPTQALPTPVASPTMQPTAADTSTKQWIAVFDPVPTAVRFAFIGAYFFALQILFRRYVRRDLRSSAYVAVSLRIILAVIGIWVVVQAVAMAPESWLANSPQKIQSVEKSLLVLGFVIGVFPRVGWQVIQTSIKRAFSIAVPSLQTQLPLSDLDGLTVWHEARLEEEDVENIPNMATADLVDLLINTRFPPDRIIDWVDQAILYTHLGPQPKKKDAAQGLRYILGKHGIRTATSLVENYNQSEFHKDRDAFESIIPATGRNTIRSLVDAVGTNPTLKLIQTWKGLMPHTHESAADESAASLLPEATDLGLVTQPSGQ